MKMVIDTDPGVDDAMAIFFAAAAPEIELLALTTVFGNVTVETGTRNALRLVEWVGLDIPVAEGAAKPMLLPPFEPATIVHGPEGFGDIPAAEPRGRPSSETAAELLCRLARENPGELTVCAIGPVTNIADAIRLDPAFARNVDRLVVMGGAVRTKGNVSVHAEANTWHDPHAMNVVLGSGARLVLVGLDVTMQILCTDSDFAEIERGSPRLGGLLREMSRFYLNFYDSFHGVAGCGLHDPAAVIACTHPHLFEMEDLAIEVVEDGEQIGRTRPRAGGKPNISVCLGVDMAGVKALFIETCARNP
jgi:inosine-uridine nucleoside N-ribohydrolase